MTKKAWKKPEIWQLKVTEEDIAVLFPNSNDALSDDQVQQRNTLARSVPHRRVG